MLVGTFKIDNKLFSLEGYDFGASIDLRLTPALSKDKTYLDEGIFYSNGDKDLPYWDSIWCNVGTSFISVDKYSEQEGKKAVYNKINSQAFAELGQIIRGMKTGCNKYNMVGSDDLYDAGYNPKSILTYEYEHGTISTKLQIIDTLDYENPDKGIELHIKNDGSFSKQIFSTNKSPHKVKLNLGEFVYSREDDESDDWDFGNDRMYTLQEIIERNPNKDYVWLYNSKYYIVKTIEEVEKVCKYLWKFDLLAFDTETTGLKINVQSRVGQADRLVGMIFSGEPGIAYYFPIAMKKIQNICTPENEHFIIDKYFRPLLEKKKILAFNGSFDWKVMYIYDICMNLVHDPYIAFKLTLGMDNPQLELGLKPLTHTFLGRDSFELSDFVKGKFGVNIKFWDFDEESTKLYACPDCDNLIDLHNYIINEGLIEKYEAKKVYEFEVLFSIVIAYQEFHGHRANMDERDALVEDIKASKKEAYDFMVAMCGHDFNPKSSPQVTKIVHEELGIPVVAKTDKGSPSLNKKAKEKLMSITNPDGTPKYPFIGKLKEYTDAARLESAFTDKISELATEEGLMFSSVSQFLETGRVSTSDPNYQGYSKVVKKYIVPRNGYYYIDSDYSTVEARIMCSWAGCKDMVKKLHDPDTDYHQQKAADMYGIPYELVTSDLRQKAKGVNFGILYGLGDPNLGVNLFGAKTPENTRKAHHQKELYYNGMEELRPFTEESRAQGVTQGYSTTYFNRRRYYNLAKTRKDTIERQSCNARIQGTAADLYKVAMVRLFREIRRRGWLGKFLITGFIHDEVLAEVSKDINPFEALSVIRKAMMIEIEGWCPLFLGMGVGATWYEAKSSEIPVQVQEILINEYAENRPDWWDGDIAKLSSFIDNTIDEYNLNRVKSYLKNKDNWGKVMMPADNKIMHTIMKDISKGKVYNGQVEANVEYSADDVVEEVNAFLTYFDMKDLIPLVNIKHLDSSASSIESDDSGFQSYSDEETEIDPKQLLMDRVANLGVAVDRRAGNKGILYFNYVDDPVFLKLVYNTMSSNEGDMEVRTFKDGKEYSTKLKVNSKAYAKLLQLYLNRRSLVGNGR